MTNIQLQLFCHETNAGLPYQHLHFVISSADGLMEPSDLPALLLPTTLIWSQGVVIEGKGPIWLYGFLVHACHPAAWVACFDPRLGDAVPQSGGAVVVSTHSRQVTVGEVLKLTLPEGAFMQ